MFTVISVDSYFFAYPPFNPEEKMNPNYYIIIYIYIIYIMKYLYK